MITWVKRMDAALRMFDSFAVVILQLVWTLYSIVQGGIYFREFEPCVLILFFLDRTLLLSFSLN